MAKIAHLLDKNIIDMAQLHGDENDEEILRLISMTGKPAIKAVRVSNAQDIIRVQNCPAVYADARCLPERYLWRCRTGI